MGCTWQLPGAAWRLRRPSAAWPRHAAPPPSLQPSQPPVAPYCHTAVPQGAKKYISEHDKDWSSSDSAWVSAAAAGGLGLLTIVAVLPLLRWMTNKKFTE